MFSLLMMMQAVSAEAEAWRDYHQCVVSESLRYAELDERPETIVTAAEAACQSERAAAVRQTKSAPRGQLDEFVRIRDRRVRGLAIGAILDVRLANSAAATSTNE